MTVHFLLWWTSFTNHLCEAPARERSALHDGSPGCEQPAAASSSHGTLPSNHGSKRLARSTKVGSPKLIWAARADEGAPPEGDLVAGGAGMECVELDGPTAEDPRPDRIDPDDADRGSVSVKVSGTEPKSGAAGAFGGRECDIVLCLERFQGLAQIESSFLQSR
ncbi:hypothetical protein HO173_004010 [Letharia columbiana]|uniref:Uncharacterized protein n=1 Tax=Letharia columbiana TaxID=112416 RepID=A0A8H6CFE1_9LECA|nr:uncharacterized protein HO173_013373 [Letharia columbiana]XP_037167127.1 uncharacterized protein HO173_004010 [Letharia columbiana]KAF6222540.1 hypothetical protein HO173_013373 [Letharia columbiana]KAF6237809.1 hypothetical protein HO173_004010 [Letharia columbiana]